MHQLWYEEPAKEWEEALPLGNGFIGAMVYGGIQRECFRLNEDSLWYGNYKDRHNPNAKEYLQEIQKALLNEDYSTANKLAILRMSSTPETQSHYQPLGDLLLTFGVPDENNYVDINKLLVETRGGHYIDKEGGEIPSQYYRQLNLKEGVSKVEYKVDNLSYERSTFISYPDNVMVINIKASEAKSIYMTVRLTRENGRFLDKCEPYDKNTIYMSGDQSHGGIGFASAVRCVTNEGHITTSGQYMLVEGATEVSLILSAATTYRENNPLRYCIERLNNAQEITYQSLKERHLRDYQGLYNRSSLEIEPKACSRISTDKLLNGIKSNQEYPEMVALYYNFGRYLTIAASRQGSLPANLQGIWNKDMKPSWDSKYTVNINTEMNYWPTDLMDLSECYEPFFTHLERVKKNGKITAKKMYGCRGFVCHHNTDIWADTAPQDVYLASTYWVLGGAWLCTHIFEHYLYTGDLEFLENKYEIMIEAARFILDFLIENKEGRLILAPSVSPENTFITPNGQTSALCAGASMDSQIIRLLFNQILEAGTLLNKKLSILEEIQNVIPKLPPIQICKEGRIMEWHDEKEEAELGHRHISHLFGLYPSDEISLSKKPELVAASRATLEHRLMHGGGHTGWSKAWIINFWARLHDSKEVYKNVNELFANSTYNSLLDKHPPFQIDGNYGGASGIVEAIVQSHEGYIHLLPALPEQWGKGILEGVRVRGGYKLDIAFDKGRLDYVTITSQKAGQVDIYYGEILDSRELEIQYTESGLLRINLEANKSYKLTI